MLLFVYTLLFAPSYFCTYPHINFRSACHSFLPAGVTDVANHATTHANDDDDDDCNGDNSFDEYCGSRYPSAGLTHGSDDEEGQDNQRQCNVNAMKLDCDYLKDENALVDYLCKIGFTRLNNEATAASSSSSSSSAAAAPPSSSSAMPVPNVHTSITAPESDTSLDGEKDDQPLSPTAKVMQLIHEYDEYERENKRVPGNLLPSLPPSTGIIKSSNHYSSI